MELKRLVLTNVEEVVNNAVFYRWVSFKLFHVSAPPRRPHMCGLEPFEGKGVGASKTSHNAQFVGGRLSDSGRVQFTS